MSPLVTKTLMAIALFATAVGTAACGDDEVAPPPKVPQGASLDTFGSAASGHDADAVRALLRAFFAAIRDGDGAAACAMLSREMRSETDRGLANGPKDERCGEALLSTYANSYPGLLNPPLSPLEAGKVRIQDDFGYGFYRTPRIRRSVLTVIREGGVWKVRGFGGPA